MRGMLKDQKPNVNGSDINNMKNNINNINFNNINNNNDTFLFLMNISEKSQSAKAFSNNN